MGRHAPQQPTVILLMGVSGSGKTTVGETLADTLGWPFFDADGFHPPANVEKMRSGQPLDDADRRPWLEAINACIRQRVAASDPAVLSCSALKRWYRDLLREGVPEGSLDLVHLSGSFACLQQRMAQREHFFPVSLLRSQFEALEPPGADEALVLDVSEPAKHLAEQAAKHFGLIRGD